MPKIHALYGNEARLVIVCGSRWGCGPRSGAACGRMPLPRLLLCWCCALGCSHARLGSAAGDSSARGSSACGSSARGSSACGSALRLSSACPCLERLGHNALERLGLRGGRPQDFLSSFRLLVDLGRLEAWRPPAARVSEISSVSASARVAHAACKRAGAA